MNKKDKMFVSVFVISSFFLVCNAQEWTRNGPFSAHVTSLAVAPSDSNVVYIGTLGDGVYKSTDMAESWVKCSTENFPEWSDSLYNSPSLPCWWFGENYPVNDIAVDPFNSEHLWIGFGSKGLYESINGGTNWQKTDPSLPDSLDVDFIHINSGNPDKIFIGAGNHNYVANPPLENGGLYYTEDGGYNWSLVDSVPHGNTYGISCITNVPDNEEHLLVGICSAGENDFSWGLVESIDGGANWNVISNEFSFYDIAVNPNDNQFMWSIIYTNYMDWLSTFSSDGGNTWIVDWVNTLPWNTGLYADNDFNLYVHETSSNEYGNVKKSIDDGITWTYIDTLCAGRAVSLRNRFETNYMNMNNIYFGTYCGTYRSFDGGFKCELKNKNIFNSYIRDIEIHPFNNNIVYAGGYQGLWKSTDGCGSWDQLNDEDVYVIRYDKKYPDTLYYGGQHLKRSYDGGVTFTDIRNGVKGDVVDIKIDPTASNTIYSVSIYGGFLLYKSTDYGNTWDSIHGCPLRSYPMVIIDPNNPDTLYFSDSRSINGGDSWESAFSNEVIAIHPQNSNTIYTSSRNTLKVSYDWGKTFQVLDTYTNWFTPVPAIGNLVFDNNNPDNMFYCTPNNGIHYTNNAGQNWMVLNGDYEKRTLDVIPLTEENKIYIATHGDGVWRGDNIPLGIEPDLSGIIGNYDLRQNYPNPFNPDTTIRFKINSTENVSLSIYNIRGQLVTKLIDDKILRRGSHVAEWNGKDLYGKEVSSDVYILTLRVGKDYVSKRMLMVK